MTAAARRATVALVALSAVVAAVALADLGIRAALRLESRWDTFFYHIPFAALQAGIPVPYDLNDYVKPHFQGFPPLPEFVEGLLWRISGSVNATGIANYLVFALFLAFCHRALRAPFWLVALISLTAPLVLIHTTVSYIDLFGNALLAMGVAAVLASWMFPERLTRLTRWGGLAGLAGAAWSKFVLVPPAFLFLALFALVTVRAARMEGRSWRRAIAAIALTGALMSVPYAKNVVLYGNPFWPWQLPVPVLAETVPYKFDSRAAAAEDKPPPLANESDVSLFVNSLFEIGHPTRYSYRERWIIDQGNAWLAYRMGGFWWGEVVVYVPLLMAMLVFTRRRDGAIAAAGVVATIAFVAVLPQSHVLRYYMFLPLSWAAGIGMLFPRFRTVFPRVAPALLVLVLGLFGHMVTENASYYRIERITYADIAQSVGMPARWAQMRPGQTYCVVGQAPIGVLYTGPTMSEFRIIDRTTADLCPSGVPIMTGAGLQGR